MKIGRQTKIIELINNNDIETQEELADLLEHAGYHVTQATISRDIRELKLTKVAIDSGRQKYIVLKNQESGLNEKFVRVLRDGFVSMDIAQNIIVIKSISGMAMAVAAALDALHFDGIVGCIAGDDTIMCAVRSNEEAIRVMEKLNKIVTSKSIGNFDEA
ncbi:ArgR family transcriptional regulator [Mobilisporobacter senegalensis]|uniref:Arginine repressor n=1 Tax=Mobilisporobacter senegalensis TaxID=1329262 RepID=A0A3N1XLW3_9FIRM|nr:arginine repressor [Mobilisporobacter senegalensis]ROR27121.1 ArgR family transcriptional regulator [Mobilisporobacter senegalensis]